MVVMVIMMLVQVLIVMSGMMFVGREVCRDTIQHGLTWNSTRGLTDAVSSQTVGVCVDRAECFSLIGC